MAGNGGIIGPTNTVSCNATTKITSVTSSGDFNKDINNNASTATVLTVAGGGSAGAGDVAGGGGAGGAKVTTCHPLPSGAVPVTIGAGGAGQPVTGPSSCQNEGGNTVFGTASSPITVTGGGSGGASNPPSSNGPATAGGSGGGSGGVNSVTSGGSGTCGQGNAGGSGGDSAGCDTTSSAGGGGGAAAAGTNANGTSSGGAGGAGLDVTPHFGAAPQPFYIANCSNAGATACGVFAGGGGGGSAPGVSSRCAAGGAGGGGNASDPAGRSTNAGVTNSGGGTGGHGFASGGTNAGGGSGIVLVKEGLRGAPGIWDMNTVFDFVSENNWIKRKAAVDYLVVAGGGAGSGGGAGGYRASGYGPTPLQGDRLILDVGPYTVTIGAGGPGSAPCGDGGNSTFSTITSEGGGDGDQGGRTGGSGGGARVYPPEGAIVQAGAGNTPPTDPPQGNPGGTLTFPGPIGPQGGATIGFSGGGGAGGAGSAVTLNTCFVVTSGNLNAGAGVTNNINGSCTAYAGGGGGFTQLGASGPSVQSGTGGTGGGAPGNSACKNGAANTGGGGGSQFGQPNGNGGSGIVIARAPSDVTFAVTPCTNSVATLPGPAGGCKVATFTVSGTLTIS